MKISEILSNLDLSQKQEYYINDDFLEQFDTSFYDIDTDQIKLFEIRLTVWYCTDSFVGESVILIGDTPGCFQSQDERKSHRFFKWINCDAYLKAKDLVEKAKIIREKEIDFVDLSEEFGDFYKLAFANDLINGYHKVTYFNDQRVTVENIESKDYIDRRVKITFEDGTSQIVNIEELEFPLLGLKS